MSVALTILIMLTIGVVDLGYGVFRQHVLSQATRQLARHAIVRGKLADRLEAWGPESVSTKASQSNAVTDFVAAKLVGWDLKEVAIEVEWLDGDNDVRRGDRLRVAMSAPYRPVLTHLFSQASIDLKASSTMSLAH